MKHGFLYQDLRFLFHHNESDSSLLHDLALKARTEGLTALGAFLETPSAGTAFLGTVMGLSPFLRSAFYKNPHYLMPLLSEGVGARLAVLLDEISTYPHQETLYEAGLMRFLRQKKQEAQCLIALADLGGAFDMVASCHWLTRLAEACLSTALSFLLREAHKAGKICLLDENRPEDQCGLVLLAMGKLGAYELNYSSDIDLIALIDETSPHIGAPFESLNFFAKLLRRLTRILQERTEDGYVFRLDLRLRPDPSATPLALPMGMALRYYEGRGQNWERAALIKARPVAGDIAAGVRFLDELSPFIWRKYLDYASIKDIHSIKRQIHTHKGHGTITVSGHNIKLGRGGIREIEFFVQTQQLIAGGRFAALRGRSTIEMLGALCALSWIDEKSRDDLIRIYSFLRDVEHRIQMLYDAQTHILPENDEDFDRVARMMGYKDAVSFSTTLLANLQMVEHYYEALFAQEKDLGLEVGNLVFTGEADDPETLETLRKLGFERPSDMCRIIRGWHFGRYKATQSVEARERLTELMPLLLSALASTSSADMALLRFDAFLSGLPAGIQLFGLLQSNPALLDMLVLIMGAAPRLAAIITRKPHIFDGMLDPSLFSCLPSKSYLNERLEHFLAPARGYEESLDLLRIFADEQRFLIGVRLLNGIIDGARAARAFSDLADLMLNRTLPLVITEFTKQYGHLKGGRIALLGMGKLGSFELSASSDLDLILIYTHDDDAEMSDGAKRLYPSQYYTRLTQRLVSALSAPTSEGVLYEVDMRLRPSGKKGPLAVPLATFVKYQKNEAWVWEHLALTRARPIAGDEVLCASLAIEIKDIIDMPRQRQLLAREVSEMRILMEKEKPAKNLWDLKNISGGLVDLEFIAQLSVLKQQVPFNIGATTGEIFQALEGHFTLQLPENTACNDGRFFAHQSVVDFSLLGEAYEFYTNLSQIVQLCLESDFNPERMPHHLAHVLQKVTGLPDLERIICQIRHYGQAVRSAFRAFLQEEGL